MNGGFSMRLVRVGTAVVIVAIAFEACEATTESRAAEAIPIQEVRGCSSKPMGGFQGGAEVIFFKPFAEAGSTPNSILASSGADEFLPAWRLWGGYANDEGLGSRIRWWQYDQTATSTPPSPESAFPSRLIFQKLDCELTQQVCFHSWELLVSGGITYVGNEINSVRPDRRFDERYRFDGVGLTAGLQAIRDSARFPEMKLVGTVQWSGAYGNNVATRFAPVSDAPLFLREYDGQHPRAFDRTAVGAEARRRRDRFRGRSGRGAVLDDRIGHAFLAPPDRCRWRRRRPRRPVGERGIPAVASALESIAEHDLHLLAGLVTLAAGWQREESAGPGEPEEIRRAGPRKRRRLEPRNDLVSRQGR